MRVAIFSDVHGNLTALEAVLDDIKQQNPDLTLFAGDLCVDGARPAACVERVRAENISAIHGNTDQRLSNQPILDDDVKAAARRRAQQIEDNDDWTWVQLAPADRTWLSALPFYRRVSPTTNPDDDLLVVHANPQNAEQHIYPAEEKQQELFGEVRQPDDDLELKKVLGDLRGGIVAFGHLHVPFIRQWKDLTLANISSVSLPLDGDQRAKYGLFTWDGEWEIEHRYVSYDVEKELDCLKSVRPPDWEKLVHRLQTTVA
ncbi:MAG: hypothetical protein CL608_19890 [Anaerolineaceae bacterium]|nr:hypothetical protein [Anaerolineaceae bacterium]